jgi:adenylate kinase
MMAAVTGTPGTGKSTVAEILEARGYSVIRQNDTIGPYIIERDSERDADVIDEDKWYEEFGKPDAVVEGHLTHILDADRIVILRLRPDILSERLKSRGYSKEKIHENLEAECLDSVLIETLDIHPEEHILEIDCTFLTPEETADIIGEFLAGKRGYSFGNTDWSDYIGTLV